MPPLPSSLCNVPWRRRDVVVFILMAIFFVSGNLSRPAIVTAPPPAFAMLGMLAIPVVFATGLYLQRALLSQIPLRALIPIHVPSWRNHVCRGCVEGIVLVLPAFLLTLATSTLLQLFLVEAPPQKILLWFRDTDTSLAFRAIIIVSAVIVAPVTEEMLYRGVLFPVLLKNNRPWVAILLSSLFFAALHGNLAAFPTLTLMGAAFAHGFMTTGSLLSPIAMHATFNACNLTLLWLSA